MNHNNVHSHTFNGFALFLLYFCIPVCPDKVDAAVRLVVYMETKAKREIQKERERETETKPKKWEAKRKKKPSM